MLWCIGHDKRQTFPKLTRYTRPICWRSGRKLCLVGKITRLLWQIKSSRTKCNEQGSWAITCTNTYVRDRDFKKEYYYYLGSNRSFWNPGWYKTSSYFFVLFFFFFLPFSVEDYNRTRWFIANGCLATLLRDKILQNMSKISYRKKETKNLKTTFITQKGDNQHFGRSDGGGGSFWLGSFPSWTTHAILKPQLRWTSKWQCINQTPVQSSSIIIIRLFLRKSDFCAVTSYCV